MPANTNLHPFVFLRLPSPDLDEVKARFRNWVYQKAMGGQFDQVAGAAHAIRRWVTIPKITIELPRSLIEQLILAVSARQETGLASLLWCTNMLLRANKLTASDKSTLADTLDDLHAETQYDRVDSIRLQISLSLVRAECVRLASQLAASGIIGSGVTAWLDTYKTDPLPEVRFALESHPDDLESS